VKRGYGHKKDSHDSRDKKIVFTDAHVGAFASKTGKRITNGVFDLRTLVKLPQALSNIDQGELGSCTANAISYAYAFDELKQHNIETFLPSRLFIYYNERQMEGTVDQDAGAQIRDGIKSINQYGVCDEHLWIYDPTKFAVKPPQTAYSEGKLAKSLSYITIDFTNDTTMQARITHIKNALQSGFPIVFGFTVYESFESETVATTGMMPMPAAGEQIVGGHAVCAVGFDDTKQCFIIKNSWGQYWGLDGYFYMPYNYMANPDLASDFWLIQTVSNPNNIPGYSPNDINPDAINLNVSPGDGGVVNPSS